MCIRDRIMRVDGKSPVKSTGWIRKTLARHKHGFRVGVTVLRNGELMELQLPVEEMPRLRESMESEEE